MAAIQGKLPSSTAWSTWRAALAPARVLIHDGARPFVTVKMIDDILEALSDADAVIPVLDVHDTLKRSDAGIVSDTVDRSGLVRAQTPQGFGFPWHS